MDLTQYEIILVNLDPTIGSEIKKTRPCVIVSPNEMNKYLKTIVIAPITSSLKDYPTRLFFKSDSISGNIAIDQIRTIDRIRIINKLGKLTQNSILELKLLFKETYVD